MYKDLYDFLQINGLQTVTILFNVVSRYENGRWKLVETGEGFEILNKLRTMKDFKLSEANSTRWANQSENLMETFYAASFENNAYKDKMTVKQILSSVIQIVNSYRESQVYFNDYYQLDSQDFSLQKYMTQLERLH